MGSDGVTLLGIDTGGTFTDYLGITRKSEIYRGKVSSTPDNPHKAIGRVFERLPLADDCRFVHGTTVATNALLEDNLGRTLFITNKGLEGLLNLGRGTRDGLYELNANPDNINPHDVPVLTVDLRDHPTKTEVQSLTENQSKCLRENVRGHSPDSVAVCLVHSYRDGTYEEQVRSVLKPLDCEVILSSEVLPRFREYERASTTTVNAGLKPVFSDYLNQLNNLGPLPDDSYIMGSDRGVLEFHEAIERPVSTVLSGPAAGIVGSKNYLENVGVSKFISMDMGGTSTDVAAVENRIPLDDTHEIAGYDISLPMVDVHTVGSGGGSVVWIDDGGQLRVGPQSAGADPGPACYGDNGPPTLTDAQLLLGRIPVDRPLSEDIQLNRRKAKEALLKIGDSLGLSVQEVALGALRLARARLMEAIRSITVREGLKPSNFSLIAHGGAGGLFAPELAEELGINTVYVPREGGVASAAGLTKAPKFAQRSVSPMKPLRKNEPIPGLDQLYEREPDWIDTKTELNYEAECRYRGQTHTVGIEFDSGLSNSDSLRNRFLNQYKDMFGYLPDQDDVVLVHLNAHWTHDFEEGQKHVADTHEDRTPETTRLVTPESEDTVEVHDLETFEGEINGPSLLSGETTTVYIPPDWTVSGKPKNLVELKQ